MGRGFSAVAALILLAGCQAGGEPKPPDGEPTSGAPAVSYACASGMLVDLDAENHQRVTDAFGETGLGARVCELFAPAGSIFSDEGGTVRATLPEGPPATATVRRPPGAA